MNAVIENWPIIRDAIFKCWPWLIVPAGVYVFGATKLGRRWIRS